MGDRCSGQRGTDRHRAGVGGGVSAYRAALAAPEKRLRTLLLQQCHGIRSERPMIERLDVDLLFHGFVGLGIDDHVWNAPSFAGPRDRHARPVGDPGVCR
ncbi:transposase [Sphingomonas aerolata]|uniref:transposase n=1 Tax=Sphingomonas aerolata TaxID=185951 RepID=UPI003B835C91